MTGKIGIGHTQTLKWSRPTRGNGRTLTYCYDLNGFQ